MPNAKRYTPKREELSAHVERFMRHGGKIQHLPYQQYRATKYIGAERYDIYEPPSALAWRY